MFVCVEAIHVLRKRGLPGIPELIVALGHKSFLVRQVAARPLGKMGPAANAAEPKLKEWAANDKDSTGCAAAKRTDRPFKPQRAAAIPRDPSSPRLPDIVQPVSETAKKAGLRANV